MPFCSYNYQTINRVPILGPLQTASQTIISIALFQVSMNRRVKVPERKNSPTCETFWPLLSQSLTSRFTIITMLHYQTEKQAVPCFLFVCCLFFFFFFLFCFFLVAWSLYFHAVIMLIVILLIVCGWIAMGETNWVLPRRNINHGSMVNHGQPWLNHGWQWLTKL